MTEYTCPRCEYTTKFKANYRMHLLRKTPCIPVIKDVPIASLLLALDGEITERPTKFTCPYCNNGYASRTSLNSHKLICKHKEYKTYKAKYDNIHNFGNECMDHVTCDFLTKCLDQDQDDLIFETIQQIYFGKDAPLNNNVRMKHDKGQRIETYKDGYWVETDEKNVLNAMIQNAFKLLFKHFCSFQKRNTERLCMYFLDLLAKEEAYYELRKRVRKLIRNQPTVV